MIGDPATRYREDPVRMLRAARLSAKLGLSIDPKTAAPIAELKHLLENVPQARLFEEILKLLLSGNAVACVQRLRELDLHHGLLPLLDDALDDPATGPFAMAALKATDDRLRADKPVSPAFLLAALLWGRVERRWHELEEKGAAVDAVAALGHARRARRAARVARHPAPLRRHHEGTVAAAAALPAARRHAPLPPAGAPALPRRVRFLRAARAGRQRAAGGGRVVGALPGGGRRGARAHAARGRRAEEEAPPRRGAKRREDEGGSPEEVAPDADE